MSASMWCFTHETIVVFDKASKCRIGLAMSDKINECDVHRSVMVMACRYESEEGSLCELMEGHNWFHIAGFGGVIEMWRGGNEAKDG